MTRYTVATIKQRIEASGDAPFFFRRDTMRFFGDTMRSFGVRRIGEAIYLYRKPSAWVNVFGKRQTAGREFFNAWRFDPEAGTLAYCNADDTQRVYEVV